ncbi:type I restriction endonuclease subunit R [Thermoactinomyces mirandus]|uniref:Type I restriction enzyme endonuclease subunit n=1 Tax=Thermoactinomyces mirandus TaxID=2756294 RepID=A0A7W1XRF3_9BACL|nr:type I restriction endonuclease subunit R [Thermoactinomyces mirandus]MBA4601801.1 type I restriction endonuclease subunit R [Thermoactinomyces mirandus]
MSNYTESDLEQAALEFFEELYYEVKYGPDLAPHGEEAERSDYGDVVLKGRLREAVSRLNPRFGDEVVEEAVRKVCTLASPSMLANNLDIHRLLTEGVDVTVRQEDGSFRTQKVWLVDRQHAEQNDWLVVNQFSVREPGRRMKKLDLVMFLNGLPLVVFELKNAADEQVRIADAFEDIQGYQASLPTLFAYNAFSVISDGIEARYGSLTASFDRYLFWRTMDGTEEASSQYLALEVLIKGLFEKENFLDFLMHFILFQIDGEEITKIVAAYHQVYATRKAVRRTHEASREEGDRKVGVIWHTQGSGKSLSMVFYTGKLVRELDNPTVVVVTDRNDLDNQLFTTFSKSQQLLRQTPRQAQSRQELRSLLNVESGGIIFTTIQKFAVEEGEETYPVLTDRRNVVVIVDEAHRSQYGFEADIREHRQKARVKFGFAKHMRDALPEASYIGFTGTPIELADRNTPAVFGDYIDIYDMTQAVEDKATVRIYYESRLAMIELPEQEKEALDREAEALFREQHIDESARGKWGRLEALVGTEKRVAQVAKDIVEHFEARQRQILGKGMIVAMSRRIAAMLYEEIIRLRPAWHDDSPERGAIKVVITEDKEKDNDLLKKHHTTKAQRERLAKRMKDPDDPLKLVIVCDMWLTGFDVPCLHTMYVDKPMRGHNLMQAIARVNRVFRDKPGGLVVDYIGIAHALKQALKVYSPSDRKTTGVDTEQAAELVKEKLDIIHQMLNGHNYRRFFTGRAGEKAKQLATTIDFVLQFPEEERSEFIKHVTVMTKAYSLCVTHPEAKKLGMEVGFFKAVRAGMQKVLNPQAKKADRKAVDERINQLISRSVITEEVVDIYSAVGLNKPNMSVLSEEFLEDVRKLEYKNLAVELLHRLLKDQIRDVGRKNRVQSKKLSEMLDQAIQKYYDRIIESTLVIEQLIGLAREVEQEKKRGKELGLSDEEIAFYDLLNQLESPWESKLLKQIARELVRLIRNKKSVDWYLRKNARAQIRIMVKRFLRQHELPDKLAEKIVEQSILLEKHGGFAEEEKTYPLSEEKLADRVYSSGEKEKVADAFSPYSPTEKELNNVLEEYRAVLMALGKAGLPKPVVGYEFTAENGQVEAEAEFAWPEQKVCFLTPRQGDYRDAIRKHGFKVWILPETGQETVDYPGVWKRLAARGKAGRDD